MGRGEKKHGGCQVMVSKALLRDFSFVEAFEMGCAFSVGIKLENAIIMTYFYLHDVISEKQGSLKEDVYICWKTVVNIVQLPSHTMSIYIYDINIYYFIQEINVLPLLCSKH